VYCGKVGGDDEDDEDEGYSVVSNEEIIYISILPTVENRKYIEQVIKKINTFLTDVSREVDKFYLIAQNQNGLFTQKTKFKSIPIKDERYDLFYGEKFPHEKMKRFIEEETENLMLLHGDPGTGKSNYIKHIITNSKKKVIYIAPSMLSVISSPQFVTFMMKNKDSILLIEDAEEVLSIDRNSATNNLLGLTDGFLKDSLGLKVIATFNCDIGRIDPALMRKGRMYLEYKFDKLTIEECENLMKFLNIPRTIKEPMTLAELFNEEDNHAESNSFEERRIGFV
jgi:SpoVK/Ycf46/Vps4 family AAA+-type ATPase